MIAAYNNGDFETVRVGGVDRQVFGFEWGYRGVCPTTQRMRTDRLGRGCTSTQAPAFAIRTDQELSPTYPVRCLGWPHSASLGAGVEAHPLRAGLRLHSKHRAFAVLGRGEIYYGGYDCNFCQNGGRAWVATSTLNSLSGCPLYRREDHEKTHEIKTRHSAAVAPWPSAAWGILTVALATCGSPRFRLRRSQPARGSGGPTGHYVVAAGIHKIQHVIVIDQENRSFDHYFGTFPGADGIPMKQGEPTVCVTDPDRRVSGALPRLA